MIPAGYLAIPDAGSSAVAGLFRKLQGRALEAMFARSFHALSPPLARAMPAVHRAVLEVARRDRAAVADAVRSPDVLAPVFAAETGAITRDDALRGAVPALLAGLANALPAPVAWEVPVPEPTAQSLASARTPITDRVHLAIADANPMAHVEDHPDKQGNAVDLGGRSAGEWRDALVEALAVIERALPALRAELDVTLARVVPVGVDEERHLSASYREAPGLVYMTLHPSALTMAEAVVHETQHGKLNALTWFDPVLDNARTAWTSSPVRPDLRPLIGVLLAVHAFVPVAALHARLAELSHPLAASPVFERRRREVYAGNAAGLQTLRERGEPTPTGRRVLDALDALHAATAPPSATGDGGDLALLG